MTSGSLSRRPGPLAEVARNPFAVAVAVALLCTLALGALLLFANRSPGIGTDAPSLSAPSVPPSAQPVTALSTATLPPTPTTPPTVTPVPTETPIPTATPSPTPSPTMTPTPVPTPDPVFEASGAQLSAMANASWLLSGEVLGKSSAPTPGELWLTAPAASPPGPFAIEAEIAVDPPSASTCDASYGLVVNAQALVWGAGVAFPCARDGAATARISDISNPADGYAADRIVRQKPAKIDPAGWHTLRLEVRGNDLRLFIDGEIKLKAEDPALWDVDASPPLAVGLWSDGVETQVRRFAIYPIDPAARLIP